MRRPTLTLRSSARAGALFCFVGASIIGCDGKPSDTASIASVKPPPKDGLSIDDEHVEARSVLAIGTAGETSWRITIATDALSCDALSGIYPARAEEAPGTRVDFWLRQAMNSDGTSAEWSVRSAYITDKKGGRGMTTRGAMLDAVAFSTDSVKVVGLDLACTDAGRLVNFTGAVLAKNCGRVALPDEAKLQEELKLSIAGKPYPVHGATIRPIGKRFHLRLSRAPHRCATAFTEGFDSYVDIVLEGDPPKLAFVSLQGDVFPDSPAGSKGKEAFVVKTEEPLLGTTAIDVTLGGKLNLTGFAFEVEGKVNALRCTPKARPPAAQKAQEAQGTGKP